MPAYLTLPMLLVLGGAILSAAGAFIATIRQNQEKLRSATQRAEFESELRSKSEEIASLNREIAASVTGGDSFPFVIYGPSTRNFGDPNCLAASITINGKFPLFDVNFEHTDLTNKIDPANFPNPVDLFAAIAAHRLPTLAIGTIHIDTVFEVGLVRSSTDETEKHLSFTTLARNGRFSQVTRLKRIKGGQWRMLHYKIVKDVPMGESVLLKEETLEK